VKLPKENLGKTQEYLVFPHFSLRTPLSEITSTGEIEQQFRLN